MKKITSYFLVFALLIGMLPLNVCADDSESDFKENDFFLSQIEHSERGHEEIRMTRHLKKNKFFSLSMHSVYFKINVKNINGEFEYKTKKVVVLNEDNATVERVCKKDKNFAEIYPVLERQCLNVVAEKMVNSNKTSEELKKMLFDDTIKVWYEEEKKNIQENVVMEFLKGANGFNETLKDIVDKAITITETSEKAHTDNKANEQKEQMEETVNFAKKTMPWLKKISDGIAIILAFFAGENKKSIVDIEKIVGSSSEESVLHENSLEKEKLEFHNVVYKMVTQ